MLAMLLLGMKSGFAATDIEVYQSSKQGRGVNVATFDARGRIIDEQTVLAGQKVTGVQAGQPVPQPAALTPEEMAAGMESVDALSESGKMDLVRAKLNQLKRDIS